MWQQCECIWHIGASQLRGFEPGTTLPRSFGCQFSGVLFLACHGARRTRTQLRSRRSSIWLGKALSRRSCLPSIFLTFQALSLCTRGVMPQVVACLQELLGGEKGTFPWVVRLRAATSAYPREMISKANGHRHPGQGVKVPRSQGIAGVTYEGSCFHWLHWQHNPVVVIPE